MSDTTITLYRLQACPFCERVVRKLDDLDIDYRSRFVEARHSRRDVVKRLTGARTVPAIVDENTGVTMSESANIVEYIEETYGDGADGRPVHVTASAAGDGLGDETDTDDSDESEADAEEVEA
jgi:glutathione S-transferase